MATEMQMMAVDVGGTFTDVIGIRDGVIEAVKVPTRAHETERSVLEGASTLGVAGRSVFNHASTVGLNAILTRRLPKVGFLTTYGHRDILDAARSWRPLDALTDPSYRRPFGDASRPLVPRYLRRGVRERITADGRVLIALDEESVRLEVERLGRCNVDGIAICLINSYVQPAHERRMREIVREVLGDIPCSISSEVSPLAKEYARSSTTVVDVFMKVVYTAYTEQLGDGLSDLGFDGDFNFADCAAMLMSSEYAMQKPFRIVFSGPAAGAVATAHFGGLIGDENLLCCDVGGTSSDLSVVTGGVPSLTTTFELEPDMLINALSVDLGSLGTGGGSVVSVGTTGEMRVGPESAGGDPGPACYGRGGMAPTMTDACLLIGLLDPSAFNDGKMRLDEDLARAAFEALETPLSLEQRVQHAFRMGLNNIAEGLVDIAIQQGVDPREYSLVAYGAAGPLMLPAVLDQVRARRVIVPPWPGLFSALGLLSSDLVYSDSRSAYVTLDPSIVDQVAEIFDEMEQALRSQIPDGTDVVVRRTFDGRLVGQSWETAFIEVPDGLIDGSAVRQMVENFHDEYERRYGNRFSAMPVEGVSYRLELVVPAAKVTYPTVPDGPGQKLLPPHTTVLRHVGDEVQAGVFDRGDLRAGDIIEGPAIVREPMSTTYVVVGQVATVGQFGEIAIERKQA